MAAPVAEQVDPAPGFHRRLLDGLAASIEERGYRETTVADIVRHARTSKRTFYDHFSTKEECFVELNSTHNEDMVVVVRNAVDPEAPWREQVRQAVTAYAHTIDATRAITLSWIRELPALGEEARLLLRRGLDRFALMIGDLTQGPRFRDAGLTPLSPGAAIILVGGLNELTAQLVEDDRPLTAMIDPAVAVATALLGAGA